MKTYTGFWSANGSSTNGQIESNNMRQLAKDLREIVKGNTFRGNDGSWSICRNPVAEDGIVIARGWVRN